MRQGKKHLGLISRLSYYKKLQHSPFFIVLFLGKEPPEATFTGNEFLTYDLAKLGGEPILSTRDEISLYFRTNRGDGLLFYTGNIKVTKLFGSIDTAVQLHTVPKF